LHSGISTSKHGYIGSGAGLPAGLGLNYAVRTHDAYVELYIDGGTDADQENLDRFNKLLANKEKIESSLEDEIVWEPLEGKGACRVSSVVDLGGWKDEEVWGDVIEALVDRMICFDSAIKPFLK
jgi:hypothetical protein